MDNTSKYLAILAKVMNHKSTVDEPLNKDKYNELYSMIYDKLNSQLRQSVYPYTSDIIRKSKTMLNTMESLYMFPELIEKKCVLVSSHITTKIFEIYKTLYIDKEFISIFRKIHTQVPILIVNDDDSYVEVLNYAGVRVRLSSNELKFIIVESGKRKIAFNKIVKFITVKTKLKDPELCLIADNVYWDAEKVFWRAVSKKIVYLDKENTDKLNKRYLDKFDMLIMGDDIIAKAMTKPGLDIYPRKTLRGICSYIKS